MIFSWFRSPGVSPQTIRSYERDGAEVRPVDFATLPARDPQPGESLPTETVELEQLESQEKKLRKQRQAELRHHGPRASRVAPPVAKDNTPDPSAFCMAYDAADRASLGLISQMAAVGKVEDFQVVASCFPGEDRKLMRRLHQDTLGNVSTVVNPGAHDTWAEDHGEYTDAGEVVIPAMLPESFPMDSAIKNARLRRFYPEASGLKLEDFSAYPKIEFSSQGAVNDRFTQQEALATAMATGASGYRMAVSYVEGGNFMPGRRADGTPFALIGKDSLAITSEVLRRAGRRGHSMGDAVKQVASDYGLSRDQVVPVEQPGEFHIDMAMALAGPGQVILNDARAVADIQKQWVEEEYEGRWFQWGKRSALDAIERRAEKLAEVEAMVEKDLRKAGLEVYRIPGCFPATAANPEMNFFNLRQGRNASGQAFAVALGGEERAEKAFAETLLTRVPAGYQRIHFLDPELTELTLEMSGGIKCRTKGRVDLPA